MSRVLGIRNWTAEVETLPDGKLLTLRHGGLPVQLRLSEAEARSLGLALLLTVAPAVCDPCVAPPVSAPLDAAHCYSPPVAADVHGNPSRTTQPGAAT